MDAKDDDDRVECASPPCLHRGDRSSLERPAATGAASRRRGGAGGHASSWSFTRWVSSFRVKGLGRKDAPGTPLSPPAKASSA